MRLSRAAALLALASIFGLAAADFAEAQNRNRTPAKKAVVKRETVAAKPAWRFVRPSSVPTLIYGAGVDDYQIAFSCQPESGLLRVIAQIGSRGVQPGDSAAIRLHSGKRKFEVAGTAFTTEARKGIDIGGATRFDPDLFVLFKGSETLVIEVPGRKKSLPITDVGPSADAFQRACSAMAGTSRPSAS
jgi:hypothetical protein